MRFAVLTTTLALVSCALCATVANADPETTVRMADEILHEVMVIPARQIPESLLAEAQGVAIIPDVIKIGFVAGIRRGQGIVMVRDSEGQWSLPQFITLTGGSVGWQAGIQGTDVILVFMTRKSVDGLLRGKFTIGADASVSAGPVGRNAAAATDARLKAEILSYSRSRGLFVGLALDGSAIETNAQAQLAYYGALPMQVPQRIPESAVRLRQDLDQISPTIIRTQVDGSPTLAGPTLAAPTLAPAAPVAPPAVNHLPTLRQALNKHATQLYGIVDERWRRFLALPSDAFNVNEPPNSDAVQASLRQFDRIAGDPKYKNLAERPEFQSTHELLREYANELATAGSQVAVPPPPER